MLLSRDRLGWILFWGCGSIVMQKLITTMSSSSSPSSIPTIPAPLDGPATTFLPDPFVKDLVARPVSTNYHGLVVTTLWPPPKRLMEIYSQKFLPEIQKCFDEKDLLLNSQGQQQDQAAAVYLYPAESLHVTIATLTPIIQRDASHDMDHYHAVNKQYRHLLQAASQHEDWPNESLRFVLDKAQIGTKAGIILWKETTGGLDQIRECLARQADREGLLIRNIPPIVHSTFLRFQKSPQTDGTVVQDRFASLVQPQLEAIFSSVSFEASWTKMICEWSPYMHTPDDDHHVLSTIHIQQKS